MPNRGQVCSGCRHRLMDDNCLQTVTEPSVVTHVTAVHRGAVRSGAAIAAFLSVGACWLSKWHQGFTIGQLPSAAQSEKLR